MTTNGNQDESAQEEMKRLEAEISSLIVKLESSKSRIREFSLAERPREGIVFAKELHQEKQNKILIEAEILLRRHRLRRLDPIGPLQ